MSNNRIEQCIDSREIAEMVGKNHKDLMRDIRRYAEQLNERNIAPVDFFKESVYSDGKGEKRPCYDITKKGCEFIAHKLTGIKGTEFTARYINRFHEMEEELAEIKPDPQDTISARELAAILKRKQCKVCYRIDSLLQQHPEYQSEFIPWTFRNTQGREFRTYELTEKGLGIFVKLLSADGNRNSLNTVKGIQRIKELYPVALQGSVAAEIPEVSLCPCSGLKELQKAEAALDLFEQCYLGRDFTEFDEEDRERFDAALCLLHDHVKAAMLEAKGAK